MADQSFFNRNKALNVTEVASLCEGELILSKGTQAAEVTIHDLATIEEAQEGEACFLQNPKYRHYLQDCKASLVLLGKKHAEEAPSHLNLLICEDPYYAWASLSIALYPFEEKEAAIDETANIHPSAKIAASAYIGPNVVIEENVVIGEYTQIHAGSFIGRSCQIGDTCVIHANCSITYTIMGNLNVVHSGACIGQDGFGFAMSPKGHKYVRQLGRVIIGHDVNIGAATTIDRGSASDTIIENGVRIDNLVQIAHNVKIGAGSVMAAQTGIAGSTTLGRGVILGGRVAIAGHLHLGDGVIVLGGSGVSKSIAAGETVASAIPAIPVKKHWRRLAALTRVVKFLESK
ncbi:MAG: UDP-3-O-(3-hydroxymyristoyl)glucosamine N-acyltransferase [Alphaproteobacteria bacterium]